MINEEGIMPVGDYQWFETVSLNALMLLVAHKNSLQLSTQILFHDKLGKNGGGKPANLDSPGKMPLKLGQRHDLPRILYHLMV